MNQNQTNIKYPLAIDISGNIVSAVTSPKKNQYTCIECSTRMKLCGGNKQQSHFRHYTDTDRICSPESTIHKAGKLILKNKIDTAIADNTPLNLIWQCSECGDTFTANLPEYLDQVVVEQSLFENRCRPDLVGFKNDVPILALEIVNTHSPELTTLQLLEANNVKVFIIKVSGNDDLITKWQGNNIPGNWLKSSADWWNWDEDTANNVLNNNYHTFPLCCSCLDSNKSAYSDGGEEYHDFEYWEQVTDQLDNKSDQVCIMELVGEGVIIGARLVDDCLKYIEYCSYDDLNTIDSDTFDEWAEDNFYHDFLWGVGIDNICVSGEDRDVIFHDSIKSFIDSLNKHNRCINLIENVYCVSVFRQNAIKSVDQLSRNTWYVEDFVNWINNYQDSEIIIEIPPLGIFSGIDTGIDPETNRRHYVLSYLTYFHKWDADDLEYYFANSGAFFDSDDWRRSIIIERYTGSFKTYPKMIDVRGEVITIHQDTNTYLQHLANKSGREKFYTKLIDDIAEDVFTDRLNDRAMSDWYSRPNYD